MHSEAIPQSIWRGLMQGQPSWMALLLLAVCAAAFILAGRKGHGKELPGVLGIGFVLFLIAAFSARSDVPNFAQPIPMPAPSWPESEGDKAHREWKEQHPEPVVESHGATEAAPSAVSYKSIVLFVPMLIGIGLCVLAVQHGYGKYVAMLTVFVVLGAFWQYFTVRRSEVSAFRRAESERAAQEHALSSTLRESRETANANSTTNQAEADEPPADSKNIRRWLSTRSEGHSVEGRPQWVTKPTTAWVGDKYQTTFHVGPDASMAKLDAAMREAQSAALSEYLHDRFPQVSPAELVKCLEWIHREESSHWPSWVTMRYEETESRKIKDDLEPVPVTDRWCLVEFTPELKSKFATYWRGVIVEERLWWLGGGAAAVLTALGAAFLILKREPHAAA